MKEETFVPTITAIEKRVEELLPNRIIVPFKAGDKGLIRDPITLPNLEVPVGEGKDLIDQFELLHNGDRS